jgi:CBS domain-containing protein
VISFQVSGKLKSKEHPMSVTIAQLLREKGSKVFFISPHQTVFQALEVMAAKDVGALIVLANAKLVGIFSERDYARKIILKGKSSKDSTVGEMMTEKVFFAKPEQTIEEAMALMTNKRIRHLPVMEGEAVIGMITIGDLVKKIIDHQEFIIEQLENYIKK